MFIIHNRCLRIYFLTFTEILKIALFYGILVFISMIGFVVVFGKIESNTQRKQRKLLSSLRPRDSNFHDSLSYVSPDLLSRITTDNENGWLYIWTPKEEHIVTARDVTLGRPYYLTAIPHSDVLSIEHVENGIIVKQLKRQSRSAENWLENLPAFKNAQSKKK